MLINCSIMSSNRGASKSLKPIGISVTGSQSFAKEKSLLQTQLQMEHERSQFNRRMLYNIKMEETKLDDDCMRYLTKLQKTKERMKDIRDNLGNTQFFLQENPHLNQLLEQMMIHNSQQVNAQLNLDTMTYQQLLELGDQIGKVSKGLNVEQIERLKRTTHRKVKEAAGERCSVCCEDYMSLDTLMELGCGHYYHEECLIGWLKEEKVCPLCKQCVL